MTHQINQNGKTLKNFKNMVQLPPNFIPLDLSRINRTYKTEDQIQALKKTVAINEKLLNTGQRIIYNTILKEITTPSNRIHFIDGPGVCSLI